MELKIAKMLLTNEELEPIYNKCIGDSHINNFAFEVAKAQLEKVLTLSPPELLEMIELTRDICPKCHGSGEVTQPISSPVDGYTKEVSCPSCNGSGRVGEPHWDMIVVLSEANIDELGKVLCFYTRGGTMTEQAIDFRYKEDERLDLFRDDVLKFLSIMAILTSNG